MLAATHKLLLRLIFVLTSFPGSCLSRQSLGQEDDVHFHAVSQIPEHLTDDYASERSAVMGVT